MNTYIFHSVNSGLYFRSDKTGLLVDGIHVGAKTGFSNMPEILAGQLPARAGLFAHVDGALFTHLHPDHFYREGLERLLSFPNPPAVYAPNLPESSAAVRALCPGMDRVQMAGVDILAKDTLHDGAMFRDTIHRSYLVRMGDEAFFLAGDAALTQEDAEMFHAFHGGFVEAAFVNLYQLASRQGQEFLRIMRPRRIFLEHLPFEEDDLYHFRSLAGQVIRKLPADLSRIEVLAHMAWVDGKASPGIPSFY